MGSFASWATAAVLAAGLAAGASAAEPASVVGSWTGKADFLLPEGLARQIHRFEFQSQDGAFLRGIHSWDVPSKDIKSHDGRAFTFTANEPFLGVVDYDGTIWIAEDGDTTLFRLKPLNGETLELLGLESGAHPVAGRGVLVRD